MGSIGPFIFHRGSQEVLPRYMKESTDSKLDESKLRDSDAFNN